MSTITVDTARLPLLLHELRLPAVSRLWQDIAARADKEGRPAMRFLSALAELELAERARRRVERHLAESRMPPGRVGRPNRAKSYGSVLHAILRVELAGGWRCKHGDPVTP